MPMKETADVVIIGGGVIGFSIAYNLVKEGVDCLVIEADAIGAKASGKADGMIPDAVGGFLYAGSSYCAGGLKQLLLPLMVEGFHRFEQLHLELKDETSIDIQHANLPFFNCALSEEEETILSHIASDATKQGLDIQWITGDEVRRLDDTLCSEVRAAIVNNCRQVEPYRYTLALAQASENRGATIKYGQAIGFGYEHNEVTSVILSSSRSIATGTVIIAMGPWSIQALSWLGLAIPSISLRGQTLKLKAAVRPLYQMAYVPVTKDEWPHIHNLISPRVDGSILVGYVEDRTSSWDNMHPETWTDSPSIEIRDLILEHAVRFVPALNNATLIEHRAAILGNPSKEGLIIGPLPEAKNVFLATVGDNGIVISPIVGEIVTDMVLGGQRAKKALQSVELLQPSRFISKK